MSNECHPESVRCPVCLSIQGERCHHHEDNRHYSKPKRYRKDYHQLRIKKARLKLIEKRAKLLADVQYLREGLKEGYSASL